MREKLKVLLATALTAILLFGGLGETKTYADPGGGGGHSPSSTVGTQSQVDPGGGGGH